MKRLLLASLFLALSVPAFSQPVLESWESWMNDGTSGPLTATKPTGVQSGDGLLIFAFSSSVSNQADFIDDLTGWTFEGTAGDGTADAHIAVYSRIADGTEGATESWDNTQDVTVLGTYYLRISGVDSADFPHLVSLSSAGPTTAHTISSITTTADNTLVFYAAGIDGGQTAAISGTGWTEIAEEDNLSGGQLTITFGSRTLASAGSTGDATLTLGASDGAAFGQIAVAPSTASSGVYDTSPTVTAQSTTAYTVTGSLDAAGDVDGVACLKDQTAPTISQVQAGNCTGDVAAEATDSASPSTGDFDFSLTLTPPDSFPKYDIYVTDGTTLTTLADEALDPPSICGENSDQLCQFIDITSIGTGSPCEDFNTAADPDIASPDILTAPADIEPGGGVDESLTISAACQFSYDGDNTGQQKAFNITIYDVSAEGFHAEDIDALFNNTAPECVSVDDQVLDQDEAINTFDLDDVCADSDGEQLTYTSTYSGTHTGSANAATLTDSAADFVVDNLIGLTIDNDTDGSSCTITDNDATTVTCTLTGGTDNDWDASDEYTVTYVLPTGLSLNGANGEVTGTPTVEDESGTTVRFTATDIGEETDWFSWKTWVVDTWTAPDCTPLDQDECVTAVLDAAPWREEEVLTANVACDNESDPAEASGEVISQDPTASSELEPFETFTIRVSTGSVCAPFDLTGLPLAGDWEPWIDILKDPEFIALKQEECDGDGTWAAWLPGTDPTPRGSANCVVDEDLIRQEADGSAQWARWAPGVNIKNSGNLQIDIREALNADFVPN